IGSHQTLLYLKTRVAESWMPILPQFLRLISTTSMMSLRRPFQTARYSATSCLTTFPTFLSACRIFQTPFSLNANATWCESPRQYLKFKNTTESSDPDIFCNSAGSCAPLPVVDRPFWKSDFKNCFSISGPGILPRSVYFLYSRRFSRCSSLASFVGYFFL